LEANHDHSVQDLSAQLSALAAIAVLGTDIMTLACPDACADAGHLAILQGAEVLALRHSMNWDAQQGWVQCRVPDNVLQQLKHKDTDMQVCGPVSRGGLWGQGEMSSYGLIGI
jgi:hypothetical protein